MTRRQHSEISVFSTSFLDLLSCGMGAVIILLIIFLSRIEVASNDATSFAMITITVEYASPELAGPVKEHLFIGAKEVVRPSMTGELEQIDNNGNWHPISAIHSFSGSCGTVSSARECVISSSAHQAPLPPGTSEVAFAYAAPGPTTPTHKFAIQVTARRTYTVVLRDLVADEKVSLRIERRQFPMLPMPGSGPKALAYEKLDRSVCAFNHPYNPPGEPAVPACAYPASRDWITAIFEGGRATANLPVRISCQVHSSASSPDPAAASKRQLDRREILNEKVLVTASEVSLDILVDQDLTLANPIVVSGSGP